MSTISIIAIVAANGAIGRGGDQPFHISEDFKRFKQLTLGHPIVMGRRTFEALPKGALPGRRNIVVSRNENYQPEGAERASSVEHALSLCHDDEIFVIGGGQIYAQALPLATRLYLTEVDATVDDADTFFPTLGPEWTLSETSETHTDPRSGHTYRFATYIRTSLS